MGQLDGKVAFITGAARGQGRSHALRLAREGADIIGIDLCEQVGTVQYAMSTPEDLAQTAKEVEDLDRRIVTRQADVRDKRGLQEAFDAGVAELGRVDIILANAGIANQVGGEPEDEERGWQDVIDINLTGVYNTVRVAAPRMIEQGDGGAIVLTSSTQGLSGRGGDGGGAMSGYAAAKHGVVGLMRTFAHWLAPHSIRVNTVHPTGVNTPMVVNPQLEAWMAANPEKGDALANLLPVEMVEAVDISNAILYLVSDAGRYVSGVTLPVDAGFSVK
ncbi:mycofactocin-coupled SDR family oxidoreductase [Actinomycetospora callitridis]|uniref:mycofactocin-coupled SDR family oxidoreductase n=1 Tax=Actinomycetospora callitridis TaxID=913944 RepID=UPI002365F33B|nr:mycofactocin-coupled SDR family oxidoreductase [Actinomycetospora callitridis]MDD7920024.1 mycofactocin-coupled SDR family oxidoreductase [Actinomycetospora callitridis]